MSRYEVSKSLIDVDVGRFGGGGREVKVREESRERFSTSAASLTSSSVFLC